MLKPEILGYVTQTVIAYLLCDVHSSFPWSITSASTFGKLGQRLDPRVKLDHYR